MHSRSSWPACVFLCLLAALPALAAGREDILIADFEGDDYGNWKTTGEAFGPGPARGTLPGQMPVSGFKGKGLVNSFHGGAKSPGTLTTPPTRRLLYLRSISVGGEVSEPVALSPP